MPLADRSRTRRGVDVPDCRVAEASLHTRSNADFQGFARVTEFALVIRGMDQIDIELWRVGTVACFWMTDWRRIRIVSAGETLSDQTFTSPSEALASARELRRFFKFAASRRALGEVARSSESAGPTGRACESVPR